MSGKRFTEEFKKEAIKQITERGYSVAEVADRLGTTTHSLYAWLKKYNQLQSRQLAQADEQVEIARLKAELKRVTEERDILKKAAGGWPPPSLQGSTNKVRLYSCPHQDAFGAFDVPCIKASPQWLLRLAKKPGIDTRARR